MPAAVKEAIRFAVESHGGRTADEALQFVSAMERDRRLIEECWT
jgi:L-alanine-DL-glutamate epimerase-like enolase superfamily enzyme